MKLHNDVHFGAYLNSMVMVHLFNWAPIGPTVPACDHVRLLRVIISADLSLDRHVSVVSSSSFYWLRQLRQVRRSLDDESAAILVHAFVTSRVDYCNLLLAGAPKLQQVMNAAAQVVSGTKKYEHGLTHLLHFELHWLDVADRVTYKLGVTVYKCLHGQAPDYLSELCSCCWTTASSFCQPPSTRCSTVSARYVRPSHLRCCWTNDMELVPKPFAWAGRANSLFSSYIEDVSFWSVLGTLSALEAFFATMCCINWHLH